MPVQARKFVVRGRVQGVGYRWFVEREAAALGLTGWVRNREDSTVELLATGEEAALAVLKTRLQEGPRASRVDAVEESEAEPGDTVGSLKSFQVLSH